MKNRRTVVVAFLLVAALLLGVGYAAVTDVLEINGSAEVSEQGAQDAFNHDIYFTAAVANVKEGEETTPNTASISQTDNDKASFSVNSLKGQGDFATFTFTITNAGDVDALVTPSIADVTGNTNSEYFDIKSDWAGATKELGAGESLTYTVTITLKKTPTAFTQGSFHILLTANDAASANN